MGKGISKWSRRRTFAPAATVTQQVSTNSGLRFCPFLTILRPTTWREQYHFQGDKEAYYKIYFFDYNLVNYENNCFIIKEVKPL